MKTPTHTPSITFNNFKRPLLTALTLAAITMLGACGGGADSNGSSSTDAAGMPVATVDQNDLAVNVGTPAEITGTPSLVDPRSKKAVPADQAFPIVSAFKAAAAGNSLSVLVSEDAEELFNWAQVAHRGLFPSNEPNKYDAPYEFRFYPATGNYVGVANGRVYTLGPMNNGALFDHGTVESFACYVKPDRCASPGMLTSIPKPTYPAGSDVLAAFNLLNKERARCGFGMVTQNTTLDTAATSHLDYIAKNGGWDGFTHTQIPGRPGFTGISPTDRATALGYGVQGKAFVGESLTQGGIFNTTVEDKGIGAEGVRGLMNAPYHAISLLGSYKEVGTSFIPIGQKIFDKNFTFYETGLLFKLGFPDFPNKIYHQDITVGEVRTYPCEGSTGIQRKLEGEVPNPVTPRNLATNPIGSSIVVKTNPASILLITSVSMTHSATSQVVELLPVLTKLNDPNQRIQSPGVAVIMSNSPLQPMTKYNVVINGTNNGVIFKREFQFMTGKDFVAHAN